MLTRLYIDNFLCFSNFELRLESLTLLLGENGSGKTSIIELIDRIRRFVIGGTDIDAFAPSSTLTRWDSRNDQKFTLAATVEDEEFEYELVIRHTDDRMKRKVLTERLASKGDTLFLFDEEAVVHLHNNAGDERATMPFDWSQSSLGRMQERQENTRLFRFRNWLKNIQLARPDPRYVHSRSEMSKSSIKPDLSDFAAWLRGHFETGPQGPAALDNALKGVLEGFETLLNQDLGGSLRRLQARFRLAGDESDAKPIDFSFEELSDGQRQLVMLYALLLLGFDSGRTLMIDEPDNFLALSEIQPWLNRLEEQREDKGGQVILVSHHPEVLNQVAIDHGTWLWREGCDPVRARRFSEIADRFADSLTSAEIVARRWTEE